MGVARGEARVAAIGGYQADQILALGVGGDDARAGGDHELDRLGVVRRRTNVEKDGGASLPRELVLANHQLVVAGRRWPVHAPKVVAHHVLTQRVEVLAVTTERVGVFGP